MTSTERTYRGIGADQRRADRRRQLLDAVTESVGESGIVATTVDAVCARAGLTKRYFYEAFSGLDQALGAALDELLTDIRQRMQAALARRQLSPERRAQVVVQTLVDSLTEDPHRARLYVEAPAHPLLRADRDAAVATFADYLLSDVLAFAGRRRAGVRRELAVRIVVAGTTDLLASWLAGGIDADRTELVRTIAQTGLAVAATL